MTLEWGLTDSGLWQSAMYGEQEGGTAQLRPARTIEAGEDGGGPTDV
jgi:hypothetical protein